eukprot:SAG31_NODE_1708_length_7482_cov_15.400108_6_plen_128_part_00
MAAARRDLAQSGTPGVMGIFEKMPEVIGISGKKKKAWGSSRRWKKSSEFSNNNNKKKGMVIFEKMAEVMGISVKRKKRLSGSAHRIAAQPIGIGADGSGELLDAVVAVLSLAGGAPIWRSGAFRKML